MSSLDELQKILESLDPKGILKGISYDRTWNESLGFTGPSDFHVGIPYNPWPKTLSDAPPSFGSVLALAIKDTLRRGILELKDTVIQGEVFIDFTQLNGPWWGFWNDPSGDGKTLAREVCEMTSELPKTVTPVLRFLIGSDGDKPAAERWGPGDNYEQAFNNTFWHGTNSEPWCTHPNAKICVGLYSPNFKSQLDPDTVEAESGSIDSLVQIVRDMVDNVFGILTYFPSIKSKHDLAVEYLKQKSVIQMLASNVLPTISWNHAKILAVDGKFLMTGGANYWTDYGDNEHAVSDLQCKVRGEAAISAHSYCDYFWKYLNKPHATDDNSFRRTTQLSKPGWPEWDTKAKVPLFGRKPTVKTGKSVLTVAKLGDWTGSMEKLEYPVQIIDAVRDLALNILFRLYWTSIGGNLIRMFGSITLPALSDEKMMASYQKAGVTPAAWASRIARCQAIAHAKQTVYIDAENFGTFLHVGNKAFKKARDEINTQVGLIGDFEWDGVIWPYDLLSALTTFMNNVLAKDGNGVFILLTSPKADAKHDTWEDACAANEIKQRIRWLAQHSPFETDTAYNKWFDERCQLRRISSDGSMYNHCKVVCCDKKLMYIGSDNPYPNYNEEHGVWIDDKEAIEEWVGDYWDRRWRQSPPADMSPKAGAFKPTMG